MTEVITTTPGLFPLPDPAKDQLSALKGHQKHDLISGDESDEIEAVYDHAREETIQFQIDAGLDRIVEGQLRWDDMLAHPLCIHPNVETGGLLRYYDNNNFYREPVVIDELTPDGDIANELTTATRFTSSLQAVIPGPYSLFDLATDEYYGSDGSFLSGITEFLTSEVSAFPAIDCCFIHEPSLVTRPPDTAFIEDAIQAIDTVSSAIDADVVVHTYWGALSKPVHRHLLETSIEAIGYDFVVDPETNHSNITRDGTKDRIGIGLVNGQNTWIESPERIRTQLSEIEDQVSTVQDVETIYVTSNTDLFYLPVNKFEEKLELLGSATKPEVTA